MTKDAPHHAESKIVIGWKERVELPEWDVGWIVAKADTGARTGAIDVANLVELPDNRVRFDVVLDRSPNSDRERMRRTIEATIARRSRVKSSFGASHDRLFVETTLHLGPVRKTVQLGLVNRKNMLCRMLLGRVALAPEFVVDPARRYVFGRHLIKKPRKTSKKDSA